MVFIGIDPGIEGGIALIGSDIEYQAYKYTSQKLIEVVRALAEQHLEVQAWVEQVHSMPAQGVASTFTFGKGFGQILGILEALNVPTNLVPAGQWKGAIGVTHDKQTSIRKAQFLFPEVSLLATKRSRKPSDGMAEALLIAEYGRRQFTEAKYGMSDKKKDKYSDTSKYF